MIRRIIFYFLYYGSRLSRVAKEHSFQIMPIIALTQITVQILFYPVLANLRGGCAQKAK